MNNMNKNYIVIIYFLTFFLILQNIPTIRAQDDVYSGLGVIPSAQTWYICSKQETNFINYTMGVVETDQKATPNFGTNVQGNHPLQYPGILGLLTYATNFTGIQLFVDPQAKFSIYWADLSCFDFPALNCSRVKNPPFVAKTIVCLGISNPQDTEQKFTLSISFVNGFLPPVPPVVSPKQTNTSNSVPTTSKSIPTDKVPDTPPYFYATNNGLSNINNIIGSLLIFVIVLLSTIFILANI